MKNGTKNIIAALILSIGLIAVCYTYVEMTRYHFETSGDIVIRTDKWDGSVTVKRLHLDVGF